MRVRKETFIHEKSHTYDIKHHGRQQIPAKQRATLLYNVHHEGNRIDDESDTARSLMGDEGSVRWMMKVNR